MPVATKRHWQNVLRFEREKRRAPDGRRRIEFSQKTRDLVARRAAFRCSFPGCGRITIGPTSDPNAFANTGQAAHIYSAAVSGKGPRGNRGLSEDELKSGQNAIWLCGNHASLVDKQRGQDYPADKLHSYKSSHETRTALELGGLHVPFGWVDRLTIHSSPLFSGECNIDLAKLNLVIGSNSVGKTALCEWMAAVSNPTHLVRWERIFPSNRSRVSAEVHYFDPDPHRLSVNFLSNDYPKYQLDGEATVSSIAPVKVIFPAEVEFSGDEEDDLDVISNTLSLHQYEAKALCDDLEKSDDHFLRAWFEEDEDKRYMHVQVRTRTGSATRLLRTLSGSERARLLMQLGMIAAKRMARISPTVLVLDSGFCRLDTNWLRRYAEILASPTCRFQTIAVTGPRNIKLDGVTWAGWKVIRLEGRPPDARILAGFFEPSAQD